jgi:hypothetical protein
MPISSNGQQLEQPCTNYVPHQGKVLYRPVCVERGNPLMVSFLTSLQPLLPSILHFYITLSIPRTVPILALL